GRDLAGRATGDAVGDDREPECGVDDDAILVRRAEAPGVRDPGELERRGHPGPSYQHTFETFEPEHFKTPPFVRLPHVRSLPARYAMLVRGVTDVQQRFDELR